MDAFGKLLAPDADFINVGGFQMTGRAEIQRHHAYSHGTNPQASGDAGHWGIFRHSTMTFNTIDIRFVRPDVAPARVAWTLANDARIDRRTGMLLFVVAWGREG